MSLFFQQELGGELIELEITDDGALIFTDYDIDIDVIAAELGDEPSIPLRFLQHWQRKPINVLLNLYNDSFSARFEVFAEIGKRWLFDALDLLRGSGCDNAYSDDYVSIIKKSILEDERLWTRFQGDHHANMSNAAVKVLSLRRYKYKGKSPTFAHKAHSKHAINDLLNEMSEISRAMSWCIPSHPFKIVFNNEMLLTAINTIKESLL